MARKKLNEVYNRYRGRYGPLNGRPSKFLIDDEDFPLALALEDPETVMVDAVRAGKRVLKRETTYRPAAILTQRLADFPELPWRRGTRLHCSIGFHARRERDNAHGDEGDSL